MSNNCFSGVQKIGDAHADATQLRAQPKLHRQLPQHRKSNPSTRVDFYSNPANDRSRVNAASNSTGDYNRLASFAANFSTRDCSVLTSSRISRFAIVPVSSADSRRRGDDYDSSSITSSSVNSCCFKDIAGFALHSRPPHRCFGPCVCLLYDTVNLNVDLGTPKTVQRKEFVLYSN